MTETHLRKKISVATSCFNEVDNIPEFYARLKSVFLKLNTYDWEIVVADNCSTDGTRAVLREIASGDTSFKIIFNSNNFGYIRSPYNAFLQAQGDAVVWICSDLQEPPEVIEQFVREWEKGYLVVCGVKPVSRENPVIFKLRSCYYWLMEKVSETPQLRHFTNFGLYDRKFITALRKFNEPYPYFRGLVTEIGFARTEVSYVQECRRYGKSKSNLIALCDYALTGFVNHTKLPLRLATFAGFVLAVLSLLVAFVYFIYKLLFWQTFNLGLAPMVIGLFFFSSVQLIFIGVIGEYIGAIWTQVKNKPLVIEDERINFGA